MAGDSPDSPLETSSPSSSTSPNKRLKTMTPELKFGIQSEQSDHQLGLRQPQELSKDDEFGNRICGICFEDIGKSAVGRIDSCDHSFCFVCIMEWAKVESRCPMCKRRFTSICRPPKLGVFSCERVVNVPQRDQVYNLSGNSTITRSAPYEDTHCTVCLGATDENLLLLCDLCDSAAHTYCVGLGQTVPEGDWFCQDCAVSRAEHEKAETEIEAKHNIILKESVTPLADSLVAVSDIVCDSDCPPYVKIDLPRMNNLPSSASSGRKRSFAAGENTSSKRTHKSPVGEPGESCARTLRRCRNVQSRIQTLRKRWNSFRNGSLGFSSSSGIDQRESSKKCDDNLGPSFNSMIQCTSHSCGSGLSGRKNDPYDTDKAWKMLEMAKPGEQNAGKGLCQFPGILSSKRVASEQPLRARLSICLSDKQQVGSSSSVNYIRTKQFKPKFHEHKIDKKNFQQLGKQKQILGCSDAGSGSSSLEDSVRPTRGASNPSRIVRDCVSHPSSRVISPEARLRSEECSAGRQFGSPEQRNFSIIQQNNPSSSQLHECSLRRQVRSKTGVPHSRTFAGKIHRASMESDTQNGSRLSEKSTDSVVGPSDLSKRKLESKASSSSKAHVIVGKMRSDKDSSEKQGSKSDDAKSEIQSLVKLNLKLLSQGKQLEKKTFKEIARHSTHTILAACGLEQPKPGTHSIPSTICNHANRIQQLPKSRLMPGSCRECFHTFAYEIVKSVMVRKIGA